MNNQFIIVLDKNLAERYKAQGFSFLHEKNINGQIGYVFSINNKKINFSQEDKSNILFTNKLTF